MRWAAAWLAAAALSGQAVKFDAVPEATIRARLEEAPAKNAGREAAVRALFERVGCPGGALVEQAVKHAKWPNVICTMAGTANEAIVVGAHFDFVERGKGVVDNWTGASLLPSLYESLKTVRRRHTLVFVAFTDEELGLVGSRFYVKRLGEEGSRRIAAMVNLDSLGTSPTKMELTRADPGLARGLAAVALALKLPLGVVNVHLVGRSDSDSFQDRGVPAIDVHSLTQKTFPILHSSADRMEAVSFQDYYDSYRLVAGYIAYLDGTLGEAGGSGPIR